LHKGINFFEGLEIFFMKKLFANQKISSIFCKN